MEDGFVKVISPIEDTPAFKAGIKPGDLIIKLDDTPVKGMTLNDAVKRMRGKPNTQITLTISRKGETAPVIVTLTRAVIRVQSVKSKIIEPGYAWVRVSQFQEATAEHLVKHLDGLFKQGQVKGLVLDLRNDPGGLLHGAVAISSAFLPQKSLVVSTDGRAEDARKKFYASPEDYARRGDDVLKALPAAVKTVPMVVLVNGGSASASEIVAGALQDHKRAKVIGTQTFGKGSVQTIMPLGNNTAIKLTTARYYTPGGRSIQALGITPDIMVEDPTDTLTRVREADLQRHLENGRAAGEEGAGRAARQARGAAHQAGVDPAEHEADRARLEGRLPAAQAIAFLKGEPVKSQLADGRAERHAEAASQAELAHTERPAAPPLQPPHPAPRDRDRRTGAAARRARADRRRRRPGLPRGALPRRRRHRPPHAGRLRQGRPHQPAAPDPLPHRLGRRGEGRGRARAR